MPSRYGSIYDSYRLSNSSTIPLYQGSTAPEALQVSQYNQGLYNTAQAGAFNVAGNADNVQSLAQDAPFANELRSKVASKIKEFADRGDYENMVPAVQQLSMDFLNRSRELALPMQQKQQWITDQVENKDNGLTPWQKAGLIAKADAEYVPLKKDPSGRFVGGYRASDVAQNIDTVKWTKDAIDGMVAQKGGQEWFSDMNGDIIIKYGDRREVLKGDQIKQVLRSAMDMDPKLQAHISQMGDIAGFYSKGLEDNRWSDKSKTDIQALIKQGYTTAQAKQVVGKSLQEQRIMQDIEDLGVGKYQQNNRWTTQDMQFNQFNLQDRLKETPPPMTAAGPASAIQPDETNYDKVDANLKDWTSQMSTIDKQIANAKTGMNSKDPSVVTQAEAAVKDLENRKIGLNLSINRAQGMMDYTKNQVAMDLSGNKMGYKEYTQQAANKILPEVQKVLGNRMVTTPSGIKISAQDIATAIADGRAAPSKIYLPSVGGLPNAVNTGLDITLANGKRVNIGRNGMGDALANTMDRLMSDKSNKLQEFNDKVKSTYKDNISGYHINTDYVTLNDNQKQSLNSIVNGAAGGIKLTNPGDFLNDIPEKDRPASMQVELVKDIAPGGIVTLAVQGYDKDKKPTQKYEAHVSSSTIQQSLGKDWLQANTKGRAPWAEQSARNITGRGASVLETMPFDTNGIDLGEVNVNGKNTVIRMVKTTANGNVKFTVVGPDGKTMKAKGTDGKLEDMSTSDIGEAGNWYNFYKSNP